jgi:methyl-accepting chemotaxis protein
MNTDASSPQKTAQKEKKPRSLKFQFTLFFVLFIIAVYSIVIITSLQQLVGITETIGYELGGPIVEKTSTLIDGDAFEALSRSLDPQDPYYEKTRLAMLSIKENSNCIYLYTMAPVEGAVFRYIIDGSVSPDDEEFFSPLGTEENISSYLKPVLQTLESKTRNVSSLDFNTQWGWVVSIYAPILNSSGEAVGVIGCDFKAEEIYDRLWSQIMRQLIVSAVFAVIGFIAYLYLVNGVNRQNQRLMELKDAAEAASAALKDERDTIAAMKDALKVGLFFMDKNFIIQDQYSKFLETVLGIKSLLGKKFTDLISPSVTQNVITNMIEYFVLLFNRSVFFSHRLNEKMLEDLNPIQELIYMNPETKEQMILRCNFVPVDRGDGKLFVLGNIQDITSEKNMQKRLAELDSGSRKNLPIK